MDYNKRLCHKKSISYLESVSEVVAAQRFYITFLNDPGTQEENTPSLNSFPKCRCTIAASKGNLQQLAEHFTSTNSNTILVGTENIKPHLDSRQPWRRVQ